MEKESRLVQIKLTKEQWQKFTGICAMQGLQAQTVLAKLVLSYTGREMSKIKGKK